MIPVDVIAGSIAEALYPLPVLREDENGERVPDPEAVQRLLVERDYVKHVMLSFGKSETKLSIGQVSNYLLSQHQMTLEVRRFGSTAVDPEQRDVMKNMPPDHFCTAFKALLNSIESKAKEKCKDVDFRAMPGKCANLHDLACKTSFFPKLAFSTFQKYQKTSGLCSFNTHAVDSSFYKELFPERFK